jgi:hypothetical protein
VNFPEAVTFEFAQYLRRLSITSTGINDEWLLCGEKCCVEEHHPAQMRECSGGAFAETIIVTLFGYAGLDLCREA